ncbi:RNA polymerase recycling motor HelD [Enterococcus columbae]|uniref:UvrD-like helicase ATP-binding domain-containing protein n=1 Tax=Enterococcus columbae DSM 7374 = ATCC 51263 TaxID=1121865 RepID=S0KPL2_9ENTE|nr:RNA polymerase recycling motor HelD [Enterococcus columbae]EOT42870.1 hypothetical protein OMW_00848 [Enterococcus columbae DSM 7374 = ATCC 51263]EOW87693.1 hypothetical protein I568_00358 [Enterococcus columbae DSM 7374 = ATCC 51263]
MSSIKELEKKHLANTLQMIEQEKQILLKQKQQLTGQFQSDLKELADLKIQTGSSEAFYESVVDYQRHEQDLLLKYQTTQQQEKRLNTLAVMENTPYFARIDFTEQNEKETLYIGIASLRDQKEQPIIIDWRAPIANLYYEGKLGETTYQTEHDQFEVDLQLKRQFQIKQGQLLAVVDTSEAINDEFLLEILDEASSNQMKNIVATIQQAQNTIIRDLHSKAMVIQGIAGSGKTSALLQRVAYILYHNRQWLDEKAVLIFSPNRLFSDYISMVLPSLGESEVPTRTFSDFLQQLLPQLKIQKETKLEEDFLTDQHDKITQYKQGIHAVYQIKPYLQKITANGPIFRSLKADQQVYLSKEQMRQWYLETNPQLPLYQRMQLLQTKLLKKLGGIQKDEAKLPWVKELVEERLQLAYEENPHLEVNERTERQLRKQLKAEIVRKKFSKIKRAIKKFQFVHTQQQYLHFLKTLEPVITMQTQCSIADFQQHLLSVREDLKMKQLALTDACLYFLLAKGLYPIYVEQKARYIFIDEMQDFPPAQVALLRSLYPKANLTLCGDLNQKVFGNDAIIDCLPSLFPDVEVTNYQLTTSYRSTQEITRFANQFLSGADQVQTTARMGQLPQAYHFDQTKQAIDWLTQQITAKTKLPIRSAIICKTSAECQELYHQLSESMQQKVQLITNEETFMKKNWLIIPAYLAKGLEFDQVFAWKIGEQYAKAHDQLILYTIFTRAMHQLKIITIKQTSPLLALAKSDTYLQE